MKRLLARTVYLDPAIDRLPACRQRRDRLLAKIDCQEIRPYDDAARAAMATIGARRHGKDGFEDDTVVAMTPWETARQPWYYHWRDEAGAHGGACQPALELNLVDGCVFRCAYCGFGRKLHFSLDVERLIEGLPAVFARYPAQRLYKYSNMTDLPPFEPELDAIPPMVRRFASEPDRYLMLFTKSGDVDALLGLEHGGRTIISWSMSSATVSRVVDRRTGTMEERIDAMARAQAAGYLVRARMSPIVPVRGWRDEYRAFFETLFARAQPDLVTLELLGWMGVGDLHQILPRDLLDDEAMTAAEAAADELAGKKWGPFTQATHEEIYRFILETVRELSPATPVSVCHGTKETWATLGGLMRMQPGAFICNCGPLATPGGPVYDCWHPAACPR